MKSRGGDENVDRADTKLVLIMSTFLPERRCASTSN